MGSVFAKWNAIFESVPLSTDEKGKLIPVIPNFFFYQMFSPDNV